MMPCESDLTSLLFVVSVVLNKRQATSLMNDALSLGVSHVKTRTGPLGAGLVNLLITGQALTAVNTISSAMLGKHSGSSVIFLPRLGPEPCPQSYRQ